MCYGFLGDGVEVDNELLGRIITLVPAKKQSQFRLSDQVLAVLQRIAEKRGLSRAAVLELAISHLDGTLRDGKPVYMDLPPEPPATHKKSRNAA
jgi:hypothetical protein